MIGGTNTQNSNTPAITAGDGTTAITLTPNGVREADEYSYVTSAINAIAVGASSNLTLQEFS